MDDMVTYIFENLLEYDKSVKKLRKYQRINTFMLMGILAYSSTVVVHQINIEKRLDALKKEIQELKRERGE